MQIGSVNYHVASAERQAYLIDAGGISGEIISPPHDVRDVPLSDVKSDEAAVSFAQDGVEFVRAASTETVFADGGAWKGTYDRELTDLLKDKMGIDDCVIFDHTVREDDPSSKRRPARNVHSDYSPSGAQQRLVDILGQETAEEWSKGHYGFVNVWRPIGHPINSAPLGFVRPSSTKKEDWITIDLVYPNRTGQIMGLVANDAHEWVYASKMTPDEIVFFNIYDNQGLRSVGHSAVDLVEDPSVTTIRKSIETRTLVRYR